MPNSSEYLFILGPLSVLRCGRVWNVELWGLHAFGLGWSLLGYGPVRSGR